MGIVAWLVVGLIAGWLAGQVMKGGGYGVLMDIALGLLGGIIGGWLFGALGIWPGSGILGSIAVAFAGAVILVAVILDQVAHIVQAKRRTQKVADAPAAPASPIA